LSNAFYRRKQQPAWWRWSARALGVLGGSLFLLAGGAFLIAVLPSPAVHARQADSAPQPASQAGQPGKGKGAKGGSSGKEGVDNGTQLDALRKDLEARIDADRKDAAEKMNQEREETKDVLGALIGLTALASLIIGFLTYASVKNTRDDAEKLFDRTREESARLVEDVRKRMTDIVGTFPEFAGLDERIRKQMREVESRMPPEADWNDDQSFRVLDESDKQEILDSEIAISASVSVFALDRVPLLRARLVAIHAALARFYLGRYNTSPAPAEGDYVRAVSYATRVVQANMDAPGGYRLRGAIHLARYEREKKANPASSNQGLLDSAGKDFAIAVASTDPIDAGAFYNLALVQHYKAKTAEAAATCRQLIALKDKVSAMHRKKYLPGIYRNLACFLALLADAAAQNKTQADKLSSESVEAVRRGKEEFEPTAKQDEGLEELKKGILAELQPGNDLNRLAQSFKDEIENVFAPAKPAAANPANASPANANPANANPANASPANANPANANPANANPANANPANANPANANPANANPANASPANANPANASPANASPANANPANANPANANPANANPANANPANIVPNP
jgi:hypothetical protein